MGFKTVQALQITHWETGKVLHEHSVCLGEAVELAIRSGASLEGAELPGEDLSHRDLSGGDLSCADLYGANFTSTNLYKANLCNSNLQRADLYRANLKWADFWDANLKSVTIAKAITPSGMTWEHWLRMGLTPLLLQGRGQFEEIREIISKWEDIPENPVLRGHVACLSEVLDYNFFYAAYLARLIPQPEVDLVWDAWRRNHVE